MLEEEEEEAAEAGAGRSAPLPGGPYLPPAVAASPCFMGSGRSNITGF